MDRVVSLLQKLFELLDPLIFLSDPTMENLHLCRQHLALFFD
jgi:hypothetical protein